MHDLPLLPRPRPARAGLDFTLDILKAHYREMPGLSLTPVQMRRLCGLPDLDVGAFESLLDGLVRERFLSRTRDGRYRLAA
jgi:hypothetical protein